MRTDQAQKWIAAAAALALLAAAGWRVFQSRHSDLLQKDIMPAPSFSFLERSGRTFSSSELTGKVWVTDFIFAHCAGSCPVLSQKMKRLQEEWKGNDGFKLVSLTVDPERDTVKALKAYADDLKAEGGQWFFLTGAKADLYKTIREGFKVTAMPNDEQVPGYDYIHSTRLILVDAQGTVRGLYDGEQEKDVEKLEKDVRYLMKARGKK